MVRMKTQWLPLSASTTRLSVAAMPIKHSVKGMLMLVVSVKGMLVLVVSEIKRMLYIIITP